MALQSANLRKSNMDELHINNRDDSDEENEFEDAEEDLPPLDPEDFLASIENARLAVHHFFNNNFIEARKILEPYAKSSMYHALGNSVFEFLEAILTFEPEHIKKASTALQASLSISNKFRYKKSIGKTIGNLVKGAKYDSYTIEQVHAELCYAEALLLRAMLHFIEDETLVSFVKAGMKIRTCYNTYKTCNVILKTRSWTDDKLKTHFESGVRMGIGAFNLMISLLPSRAISLLEFIGFSGNKEKGLADLELGYNLKNSIRQVLSVMTLLSYHLIVTYVLSHRDGDLDLSERILNDQLALYPNGVWFLFYKGRLELMRGNVAEAQSWYKKSWQSQDIWPQFHHLCFWELMWTYTISMDWLEASKYADRLLKESKWSRTIYSYQKASLLLMLASQMTDSDKAVVDDLMRTLPNFKQRIAGKSLPMEKFVIKRSNRFYAQKKWLCLPGIELMYLMNYFKTVSKDRMLMMNIIKLIDRTLMDLPLYKEFDQDNRSLLYLLKGSALRVLGMYLQAEESFQYVMDNERKLKEDTFLVPNAVFELALVHAEQKHFEKAATYLDSAKKNYSGYSLESRLHFRIHSANSDLIEEAKSSRSSLNSAST